jgi:hypothetical protein
MLYLVYMYTYFTCTVLSYGLALKFSCAVLPSGDPDSSLCCVFNGLSHVHCQLNNSYCVVSLVEGFLL